MKHFRSIIRTSLIPIVIMLLIQISSGDNLPGWTPSLAILKAPSYFKLQQTSATLKTSRLNDLILSITGFEIDQKLNWNGIVRKETISVPSITLVFVADNQLNIDSQIKFNLENDNGNFNLKDSVKDFDHIPTTDELKNECSQLSLIYKIHVDSKDPNAGEQIKSTIAKFNECVSNQNSLLALLLVSPPQPRIKREVKDVKNGTILNPAEFYLDQYPAIFNILFWLSLILAIVIYAIAYNMWYMDPGLDTVIYRMTSQRIKKDQ